MTPRKPRDQGTPVWGTGRRGPRSLGREPVWGSPQTVSFLCHALLFLLGGGAFLAVVLWFLCHRAQQESDDAGVESPAVVRELDSGK